MKFSRKKYNSITYYSLIIIKYEIRIFYRNEKQSGYLCDFNHKIMHDISVKITKEITSKNE